MTLPKGWATTTLGGIADTKLGKMLDKSKNVGRATPYLRNINVRWGFFDLTSLEEMKVTSQEADELAVKDGDIFVCEGGEPGRAAVWSSGRTNLVFQKALHRVRMAGGGDPHFLALRIRFAASRGEYDQLLTGTTIKHLPQTALQRLSLELAPFAEQRRIVAKLNALMGSAARAKVEIDRVQGLARRLRQGALEAAFAMRPGWTWRSLGSLGLVSGGLTKNAARNSLSGRVKYLRVANVYANELRLDDVGEIGVTEHELQKTRLRDGDLLIVEGNGSLQQVGRAAVWRGELTTCSHQNHLIRFRSGEDVLPEFVLFWLISSIGRERIERLAASTSGLHTLSISKICGIEVPLAPIDQQQQVVRTIKSAFARAVRLEAEAARALALLDRLEAAILAKAFRGELVPQDPTDEPASVMLERIRAARAASPKTTRKRRTTVG